MKRSMFLALVGLILLASRMSASAQTNLTVVRHGNNSLWAMTCEGITPCSGWTKIPGKSPIQPTLMWEPSIGKYVLLRIGTDRSSIFRATFNADGTFNNNWTIITGASPSPVAAVTGGMRTGTLTIPVVGSSITGGYTLDYGAAIYASGAAAVDWYAPVYLPKGATITEFSHAAVDFVGDQSVAELFNWATVIASVSSPYIDISWNVYTTSAILSGYETVDENAPYHVHVHLNGNNGTALKSGYVRIKYTYTAGGM